MSKSENRPSLAFTEGLRAKRDGLTLEQTAIKNLKAGTRQYNEYLAGFNSLDAEYPSRRLA